MRVEEIGRVYQWDAERRVRALGAPAGAAIAMANDGAAQGWSVPVEADGTAPISPELLQSGESVTCWLTVGGHVVATDRVPVVRRAKPADYAYAPTDAKRVEDLRVLLEGLTAQAKGAAERWPALEDAAKAATNAANDAAADVLRRAEAGEFDGPAGIKGEQGAPGRDGALSCAGASADMLAAVEVRGAGGGRVAHVCTGRPVEFAAPADVEEVWRFVSGAALRDPAQSVDATLYPMLCEGAEAEYAPYDMGAGEAPTVIPEV